MVAYGTFQLANISINDLTDTPSAIGSAGQALVVNSNGNALTYSNASSAEVYGFEKYYSGSTINITVTASGGVFLIDGVAQQTLNLYEGTLMFSVIHLVILLLYQLLQTDHIKADLNTQLE